MAEHLPLPRPHRALVYEAESLEQIASRPGGAAILAAEAADPNGLLTPEALAYWQTLRVERERAQKQLGLFARRDDVVIVPGFMGSCLTDVQPDGFGLIWIDPKLVVADGDELRALQLGKFSKDRPEQDAAPSVLIRSNRALPAIYDVLRLDLELRGHDVQIFPFDWRKNIDEAGQLLAAQLRARVGQKPRPVHLIAHSQGSLVARRAIHLLGANTARRLIKSLVLLGPASFGTFAAAFAIAGSHETIDTIRNLGVKLPDAFETVLQSFTGLYQLLPWKEKTAGPDFDPRELKKASFWKSGIDKSRLTFGFGWSQVAIDTSFFNDRTAIILGEGKTVGAVAFDGDRLVEAGNRVDGDGTVPDGCALLPGVRAYRAPGATHMKLPLTLSALAAVRALLRGEAPAVARVAVAVRGKGPSAARPAILREPPPFQPAVTVAPSAAVSTTPAATGAPPPAAERRPPPQPPCRRLRVFSFDPLLATDIEELEIADIVISVPWELDGQLGPGPVGEYLEVVDYDPASRRFYHPVDLSHPRLLAQDGLPAAESNPQFHQQMCYAVAMATIDTFEKALGRRALWSPRLKRDAEGQVQPRAADASYVPRLRIYPHALRDANAFYDPDLAALLFGYFPSRDRPGGRTMPGATIFTCQSYDVVAHETTHALLHGLHRYYIEPSNPDALAFHEAFADIVALFQHFSHPDVVRDQIRRTRGDLSNESLLGQLAQQFGEALGEQRQALRQYIGTKSASGRWEAKRPNPELIRTADESHDRGAILVAAVFRAFLKIYRNRAQDLLRIARGGTGVLPDGELHPDLVGRLAVEASKSAEHVLIMCVRALDYVPPVDVTFGEYLRALITADYDLVRDDDKRYRAAVIDAFREWGLYPADVNVLDEAALLWQSPRQGDARDLQALVEQLPFKDWNLRVDRRRAFLGMEENAWQFRRWLYRHARQLGDGGDSLGLYLFPRDADYRRFGKALKQEGRQFHSIPRNERNQPRFEVHSLRPCCRVGPDGQQRIDLVAEVVQKRAGYFSDAVQAAVDRGPEKARYWAFTRRELKLNERKVSAVRRRAASQSAAAELPLRELAPEPDFWFRGGCTLVIDAETGEIRYCIVKNIDSRNRLARQRDYENEGGLEALAADYLGAERRSPFALLHEDH